MAETAAETYKTTCAMCHGADGKGDTALGKNLHAKDLTSDEVQKQSDAELSTIIVKGKENMPGFEGRLTPAQIKGLVTFIRALKK
jgi:cytochrome c6